MEEYSMYKFAMDRSMEKQAEVPPAFGDALARGIKNVAVIGGGAILGGYLIKSIIDKLRSDTVRKNLLEDVIRTDPVLKSVDRNTISEWYASIYQYAPTLSKDKQTVKEVLTTFARYGKPDLQTLKMLADTEKSVAESGSRWPIGGGVETWNKLN